MKRRTSSRRILAAIMCIIMVVGMLPITLSAAKDKYQSYEISSVALSGVEAPIAGETFDFTVDENSQKYNVVKVAWKQQYSSKYITSETSRASVGITYELHVILEVATTEHYFKTNSGRVSAVTGTVNGATANVNNSIDSSLYSTNASKYEFDSVYKKYVTVVYAFPEVESIPVESFNVVVKKPEVGAAPATKVTIDTVNGRENHGYINVDNIEWTKQTGGDVDTFEFGETYILKLTLSALYGREFVPDPTNILSTKDNPMPKVNVTVNGESASAFPISGVPVESTIQVHKVFSLTTAKKLNEINIEGISAPKTGDFPSYVAICPTGVDLAVNDTGTSLNGITWIEGGSSAVPTSGYSFLANTPYIVKIELKTEKGYEFNNPTVKIAGKTATNVEWTKDKLTATYEFASTGNNIIKSVAITGIDLPEIDKSPDYKADLTHSSYELDGTVDRFFSDGVMWYNEDKKSGMYVGAEKFEENKTYTVQIGLIAKDGYDFAYENGVSKVSATVNGKIAKVSARSEFELFVEYTFPALTKAPHTCSLTKVDEVKVSCETDGQKAYYTCKECGKCYEDSKGTKQISDIHTWGITEAKGHNYGTTWGYKDALVHAHTCKTCGKPGPSAAHSGGNATCKALAKCSECRQAYGYYGAHKFNSKNKCTLCGYVLPFTDVKNTDYYIDAVAWALQNGITTGMSATEFGPKLTCTRGQVVTFLWRAAGKPEPTTKVNPFTDVKESDYFYKAVLWAVESGITNGTSATKFTPDQTCSTAHIITFLYRTIHEGKDGWYKEAADWAKKNDLLTESGLTVDPAVPCPRGAVVTFMSKVYFFN